MSAARVWARRLGEGWRAIAARFAEAQTLVILTALYLFVMGPFALALAALRHDPLDRRRPRAAGSLWRPAETRAAKLEHVRQPF